MLCLGSDLHPAVPLPVLDAMLATSLRRMLRTVPAATATVPSVCIALLRTVSRLRR